MDAEFGGGKFKRLFRGSMWSGLDRSDIGDPRKVNMKQFFFLSIRKQTSVNFTCFLIVLNMHISLFFFNLPSYFETLIF